MLTQLPPVKARGLEILDGTRDALLTAAIAATSASPSNSNPGIRRWTLDVGRTYEQLESRHSKLDVGR
jgi:hypothetical protein